MAANERDEINVAQQNRRDKVSTSPGSRREQVSELHRVSAAAVAVRRPAINVAYRVFVRLTGHQHVRVDLVRATCVDRGTRNVLQSETSTYRSTCPLTSPLYLYCTLARSVDTTRRLAVDARVKSNCDESRIPDKAITVDTRWRRFVPQRDYCDWRC